MGGSSLNGLLLILRGFRFDQITKRRSEDLRKVFSRLEVFRLQKYGDDVEIQSARRELNDMQEKVCSGKRKNKANGDESRSKKIRQD